MSEGDAATDKSWAASVYYEAGHILEHEGGDAQAAARAYTTALSSDPTFQPTAWALRRQLSARGHWKNLVRAVEAEARFASNTRSADRSDLWLERGWVLREQLGRVDDAQKSFEEATNLHPGNRAAWLASLLGAVAQSDALGTQRAFEGLLAHPRDLTDLASWAGAYALWLMAPPPHGAPGVEDEERASRALTALIMAFDAGARDQFVLDLMDRASAGRRDMRLQVLDRLVVATSSERQAHARASQLLALRERARRLFLAGDVSSAVASLDEALALFPEHPIVAADRLDLAVLEGRLDVLDQWHPPADPEAAAELVFRRVEVARSQGAWGEAVDALQSPTVRQHDLEELLFVERTRTLAALGDAQALAEAYEAHADALIAQGSGGAQVGPVSRNLSDAVHLYVRAGVLWEVELADSLRAETLYGQALALMPSYRPAVEGLASVFTREGRWERLVDLVAADAAAAASSERASALRESLVLLNRDVLGDLKAALAAQGAVVESSREDVRALYRWLDLCGRLSEGEPGALSDGTQAVRRLLLKVRAVPVRAALALLAVRLVQGTSRDAEADGWLERALAMDPASLAPAFIERRSSEDAARVRVALQRELDAWSTRPETEESIEKSRALRFRLAFRALESGWPADAMEALEPLLVKEDEAARAWHLDIARRTRDPQLLRRVLATETAGAAALLDSERVELSILLGETLETAGRKSEARSAFDDALALAPQAPHGAPRVRAALGRLRVAAAEADIAGILQAQMILADSLPAPTGAAFARDARHLLVATGGAVGDEVTQDDPVLQLTAAIKGVSPAFWTALGRVAESLAESPARADVLLVHGLAGLLGLATAERSRAVELLSAAHGEHGHPAAEVVLTDLLADATLVGPAASARAARIERLKGRAAGDAASEAIGALLALEQAAAAEAAGDLGAAAEAYGLVLRWRSESLEALEGLRRLAQLAGARADEALLLERIGDSLVNPAAAAAHYAEAALLLEADGSDASAIRLFHKVLARAPDDDEAFERLCALLRTAGAWPRLERLIGFKLTRLQHTGARCVPLWLERARTRRDWLQDEAGAHADWQRLLRANAHVFEAEWRLGQALRTRGSHKAARKRFEAALAAGEAPAAVRLGCLLDIAELCAQSGDSDSARQHLQQTSSLFEHLDSETNDRVVSLAVRLGSLETAVRALETVAESRSGPARATQLVRVGRLWRDSAGGASAGARSAAAYLRAVQADAFSDAALDLAAAEPLPTFTPDERRGLTDAAEAVLSRFMKDDPFDVRTLELVRAYALCTGEGFRVAMSAQILFMQGHGHVPGHGRNLSGSLAAAELQALGTSHEEGPRVRALAAVWPALAEQAAKAWFAIEPGPAVGRASRVQFQADARLHWLEAAATTLGITDLVLHRIDGEATVSALAGARPGLAVGSGLLGGDPASRFRVGYALALLRLGVPFLAGHSESDATRFCVALLAEATSAPALQAARHPAIAPGATRPFAKKVARAVEGLGKELEGLTPSEVEAWVASVARAAARFALAVSGDVAESAFALAGTRKLDVVQVHAGARSLVRFSLSAAHGQLRERLGVEPRTQGRSP